MIDFVGAEVISASLKEMRKNLIYVMQTQQGKIVTSSANRSIKIFFNL